MTRVYRDVLKYVHANNEYGQGTLLTASNFKSLFGFLYFDLTKQKMDIRDGTTGLVFLMNYQVPQMQTTQFMPSLYTNKMLNLYRNTASFYSDKYNFIYTYHI